MKGFGDRDAVFRSSVSGVLNVPVALPGRNTSPPRTVNYPLTSLLNCASEAGGANCDKASQPTSPTHWFSLIRAARAKAGVVSLQELRASSTRPKKTHKRGKSGTS